MILGNMLGGTASKLALWCDEESQKYRYINRFRNEHEALNFIKTEIIKLIRFGATKNLNEIKKVEISPMFMGKILSLYYPKSFINVFSEEHVDYFLKKLNLYEGNSNLDIVDKRELLVKFKNYDKVMKKWSLWEFSHFLYNELGGPLKKGKIIPTLIESEVKTKKDIRKSLLESEILKFPNIGKRNLQAPKLKKIYYYTDEIKKEQASSQHTRLITKFSKLLQNKNITPLRKGRIDLFGTKGNDVILFEMKSITQDNERKQIRNAIGQLSDYEFIELNSYRKNDNKIIRCIALERKPSDDNTIGWLKYLGIFIYWLDKKGKIKGNKESLDFIAEL